jgi:hypothetical protein
MHAHLLLTHEIAKHLADRVTNLNFIFERLVLSFSHLLFGWSPSPKFNQTRYLTR